MQDILNIWLYNGYCLHAVERQAEALAVHERELAQREASLQNEQDQLRQQRSLLQDSASAIEKERAEARDMLKVSMPSLTACFLDSMCSVCWPLCASKLLG